MMFIVCCEVLMSLGRGRSKNTRDKYVHRVASAEFLTCARQHSVGVKLWYSGKELSSRSFGLRRQPAKASTAK